MNKRKNRVGSVRAPRQRSTVTEGVYNNPAFMHAATSQVGNTARITTAAGQIWEGVYKTWSPNFDVVLELAAKVANPDTPDSHLDITTVKDKLIFKASDILSIIFQNVDLDYPVKDTFQTDTAIAARLNGSKMEEKELEPWDAGQMNGSDNINLELEPGNGWDVNDMFRKNEQDYGVQSTFDHTLRGYTVPLETSDTADYRDAQARADQIANEIENQPNHKARCELENGDEETVFAAVVRPNLDSNGKYIPPAKRNGQNNGKLVRSTPPPSSGSSSQNSPSPKENRTPLNYPTHNSTHQNVSHTIQSHTPPQSSPQNQMSHGAPQHVTAAPQSTAPQIPHAQNSLPIHQTPQNQPIRPNSHTPPHQYQQGPPSRQPGGPHGIPHGGQSHNKSQINGETKSGSQQRHQRHQYQGQDRSVPIQGNPAQIPGHYQDIKQSQDSHSVHQLPQQALNHPPTRTSNSNQSRHEPPQNTPQTPLPQPGTNVHQIPSPHITQAAPQPQPHLTGTESPQIPQNQSHLTTSPNLPGPGHNSSGSSSNSNTSLNIINPEQNQASGPSNKQPSPSQSPPSNETDKLQTTVAKSKLNPNAKEFVLNPAAKPFQPRRHSFRSPSTPSASRPHTPQTPSHSPYMAPAVSGPGAPSMPMMMHMPYIGISQAQYQPPPQQTNRIRKIPVNQLRTDVASQMHHAAAVTGQPLLAPAPLPQFIYNASPAAAHGMNQASYPPTVAAMHAATFRMYDAAAAAAAAAPQLQYLPPQPSGTASPAQPPYNPAAVQQPQGPQQAYQTAPPPQPPPQICSPMFCIPAQPHMLPSVPAYLQQAPPPPPPHQHVQVLVPHQHPGSQGGNPHGPNP
ncbi:hypothetical protein GWI33_006009 [Rhynchophorus ferrugineus]|uniref:LsmAD domain-containing protein n=1 Tax=Rhynchophorus ferrugineus TaxID=354439 RepID=A0A834J066_RHYFE|nr:hypothetical protein GWI33_006009 [Rhynchophorus ferrugineus]